MAVLVGRASDKGGRGRRNRKEIGAGAMKNRLHRRGAFLSLNRKWAFTVFFMGEMLWQFCQQVLAIAWSLLSFYGRRRNVLIENLYDRNFASRNILDDQISEMLLLSCTAMELSTEKVNLLWERPTHSLYYSVLENNALHRTVDETHTVEKRRSE